MFMFMFMFMAWHICTCCSCHVHDMHMNINMNMHMSINYFLFLYHACSSDVFAAGHQGVEHAGRPQLGHLARLEQREQRCRRRGLASVGATAVSAAAAAVEGTTASLSGSMPCCCCRSSSSSTRVCRCCQSVSRYDTRGLTEGLTIGYPPPPWSRSGTFRTAEARTRSWYVPRTLDR